VIDWRPGEGSDQGPTPPDLFVASLGSCVGVFVANYCRNAGTDVTDLSVDVAYAKAEDPTRLTNVRVRINLPHGDYARREKAILRVAERCPVHETVCTLDEVQIHWTATRPMGPAFSLAIWPQWRSVSDVGQHPVGVDNAQCYHCFADVGCLVASELGGSAWPLEKSRPMPKMAI
jgi:uncharacterized OsmC-like protein